MHAHCALTPNVEAALGQLENIQIKLSAQEQDIRREIDELESELRKEQDPSRMQLIQEMISVRVSR